MTQGFGMGSGNTNPAEIKVQGSSTDSSCLSGGANQTSNDFTFNVSGVAQQCETGFDVSLVGGGRDPPYNFTVVPLDQSFFPFDVLLNNTSGTESNWVLNLTAGSRFTIMLK
jgi:hypothetical protein